MPLGESLANDKDSKQVYGYGYTELSCPRGELNTNRPRWWSGGVASTTVACIAAPMDLIKTHMQTQRKRKSMYLTAKNVVSLKGFIGFYDGFGAAALRQMLCTSLRFSIYEKARYNEMLHDTYVMKMAVATFAGMVSAIIGIPLDLVNVRMQNDMKNKEHLKRNYKHVFDGLQRICTEEGYSALYAGASAAVLKAGVNTCGQIAGYDLVKTQLVHNFKMKDDVTLHFTSSLLAAIASSIISQPFDVLKTLMMNAYRKENSNIFHTIKYMLRFGPLGIFRGLLPTLARKGPATIMLFLIYEQLRIHLGYIPLEAKE